MTVSIVPHVHIVVQTIHCMVASIPRNRSESLTIIRAEIHFFGSEINIDINNFYDDDCHAEQLPWKVYIKFNAPHYHSDYT